MPLVIGNQKKFRLFKVRRLFEVQSFNDSVKVAYVLFVPTFVLPWPVFNA
jgi:hypothetical protein